jgi:hypothetical protein
VVPELLELPDLLELPELLELLLEMLQWLPEPLVVLWDLENLQVLELPELLDLLLVLEPLELLLEKLQ